MDLIKFMIKLVDIRYDSETYSDFGHRVEDLMREYGLLR